MKKIFFWIFLLIGIFLLLGCSLESEPIILLDGSPSEMESAFSKRLATEDDEINERSSSVRDVSSDTVSAFISGFVSEYFDLSSEMQGSEDISDFESSRASEASDDRSHIDDMPPACNHLRTQTVGAVKPTCADEGNTGDTVCSDCGELIQTGQSVPATGHQPVTVNQNDATVSREGYSGDKVCKICHLILAKGSVIPKINSSGDKGHGMLVWIPVNGGTKYHSKSTCSKMKNPEQVSVETAVARGFTPCKKCYQ